MIVLIVVNCRYSYAIICASVVNIFWFAGQVIPCLLVDSAEVIVVVDDGDCFCCCRRVCRMP